MCVQSYQPKAYLCLLIPALYPLSPFSFHNFSTPLLGLVPTRLWGSCPVKLWAIAIAHMRAIMDEAEKEGSCILIMRGLWKGTFTLHIWCLGVKVRSCTTRVGLRDRIGGGRWRLSVASSQVSEQYSQEEKGFLHIPYALSLLLYEMNKGKAHGLYTFNLFVSWCAAKSSWGQKLIAN